MISHFTSVTSLGQRGLDSFATFLPALSKGNAFKKDTSQPGTHDNAAGQPFTLPGEPPSRL